jgi:hypothetical protein
MKLLSDVSKRWLVGAALCALAGCGGSTGDGGQPPAPTGSARPGTTPDDPNAPSDGGASACASSDTWDGFAAGFFAARCAGCHGAGRSPGPSLYDPTSYESVSAASSAIVGAIGAGKMPPSGDLSDADKQRVLGWLACTPPPR